MKFAKIHGIWDKPTIFHITQYKCGSQWVAEILKWCAHGRSVLPEEANGHLLHGELLSGFIYPTCYVSKPNFEEILSANQHIQNHKKFLVIRDPRDICVSLYFSMRNSHEGSFGGIRRWRKRLNSKEREDGLLDLIDSEMPKVHDALSSWLGSDIKVFKFEDLVADPHTFFKDILAYCEIEVADDHFDMVLENNSFKALSGGRKAGEENPNHHYRKGTPGDWRNYFTAELEERFNDKFGAYLDAAGYQ